MGSNLNNLFFLGSYCQYPVPPALHLNLDSIQKFWNTLMNRLDKIVIYILSGQVDSTAKTMPNIKPTETYPHPFTDGMSCKLPAGSIVFYFRDYQFTVLATLILILYNILCGCSVARYCVWHCLCIEQESVYSAKPNL